MNLEVRKVGKRKKYYLAHSFREGKKISKIRRYLGANLSKKDLQRLRPIAEEIIKQQIESYRIIKDPLSYELNERELKLIENLGKKANLGSLHLSEGDWRVFTELFTYNTNAIEGSELREKEVKDILEKNEWPYDANKSDISEAYGVAEAITHIRKTSEHISISLIKKLHKIVFKNSKSFAGKLRPNGVEVAIRDTFGNIAHVGDPANRIPGLLEELAEWYEKHKNKYPPLLLAAVAHNQFETIHPFQDGNGRVGRLLLNNILLKHKLPPVNITLQRRREYYRALQDYQKKRDIRSTIDLMLKEYRLLKKELGDYKKK
jgi:Fic family protein